jgi:hypothetical protein
MMNHFEALYGIQLDETVAENPKPNQELVVIRKVINAKPATRLVRIDVINDDGTVTVTHIEMDLVI